MLTWLAQLAAQLQPTSVWFQAHSSFLQSGTKIPVTSLRYIQKIPSSAGRLQSRGVPTSSPNLRVCIHWSQSVRFSIFLHDSGSQELRCSAVQQHWLRSWQVRWSALRAAVCEPAPLTHKPRLCRDAIGRWLRCDVHSGFDWLRDTSVTVCCQQLADGERKQRWFTRLWGWSRTDGLAR